MAKTATPPLPASALICAQEHVEAIVELLIPLFRGEEITHAITKAEYPAMEFPPAYLTISVGKDEVSSRVEATYDRDRWVSRGASVVLTGYVMYPGKERSDRAPLKKDGTFAYDRIAHAIASEVRRVRSTRTRAATIARNRGENLDWITEFNKCAQPDLGRVSPSEGTDQPPLKVQIGFSAFCDGPAALELGRLLRDWHNRHVPE